MMMIIMIIHGLNYNIFIINDIILPSPVNISIQYMVPSVVIIQFLIIKNLKKKEDEEISRNLNPFPC